jgi:hypothetical protein
MAPPPRRSRHVDARAGAHQRRSVALAVVLLRRLLCRETKKTILPATTEPRKERRTMQ